MTKICVPPYADTCSLSTGRGAHQGKEGMCYVATWWLALGDSSLFSKQWHLVLNPTSECWGSDFPHPCWGWSEVQCEVVLLGFCIALVANVIDCLPIGSAACAISAVERQALGPFADLSTECGAGRFFKYCPNRSCMLVHFAGSRGSSLLTASRAHWLENCTGNRASALPRGATGLPTFWCWWEQVPGSLLFPSLCSGF